MSQQNFISATLSPEDRQAVLSAIATINAKLPFLRGLSPEERRGLPKMGDKSLAFVAGCRDLAVQSPGFLPRSFDLAEFERDLALVQGLEPIATALAKLSELLNDTATAVGSDAYAAALVIYQSARVAGQNEGLDAILDDLGQRFARRQRTVPAAQAAAKP
jgi:hypothetical protein